MSTTIVILQHGEKEKVPGDPGLTELGHRQAAAAALVLAQRDPVAVVASPLKRARQTAERVASACGAAVTIDPRLRERMNLEPGQDLADFVRDWSRSTEDRTWTAAGARSSHDTAVDLLAALDDHAVDDGVVIMVGHGGATTDLLRTLLGDDTVADRAPGLITNGMPGAAITVLERSADGWVATQIADVAHLAPGDRTGHVVEHR